MKIKVIILATVTIAISTAGALILGELLLRGLGVQSTLVYLPSPYFGWGHTPNTEYEWITEGQRQIIKINSLGLRDNEYLYEKPANTYRVLVMGDSYAEALQVSLDQSFTKLVEQRLNAEQSIAQMHYEVINAGVSGYGTDNALLFFQHEGYKYRPNLVVLALYIGNDVRNNWHELENIDVGGFRKPYFEFGADGLELKAYPFSQHESIATKSKVFLNQNFVIYSFLREVRDRFRSRGMGDGTAAGVPLDFGVFEPDYSQQWLTAWRITEALLAKLKSGIEAQGGALLVVLIPTHFQVDRRNWASRLANEPALADRQWDLGKPNRVLRQTLGSLGIDHLDLLPALRSAVENGDRSLYFQSDGHWNAAGHEVGADSIARYISDLNADH